MFRMFFFSSARVCNDNETIAITRDSAPENESKKRGLSDNRTESRNYCTTVSATEDYPRKSRQTVYGISRRRMRDIRELKIVPLFLLKLPPMTKSSSTEEAARARSFANYFSLVSQRNRDIELKSNNTGGFLPTYRTHR
ncbi:hypothetical protein PUN28_013660 [Cardiocondyla obscurior]|uniref:Uncharacterized protein n=1 Tax=Cardiocondyla obscurior TaxID=286306 RepID=A0AAW2F418_9HYME